MPIDPISLGGLLVSISQFILNLQKEIRDYQPTKPGSSSSGCEEERTSLIAIIKLMKNLNDDFKELRFFLHQSKEFHESFQQYFGILDKTDPTDKKKSKRTELNLRTLFGEIKKYDRDKLKELSSYLKSLKFDQLSDLDFSSDISIKVDNIARVVPISAETIDNFLEALEQLGHNIENEDYKSKTAKQLFLDIDDSVKQGLSYADKLIHNLIPVIEACDRKIYTAMEGLSIE